MTNIRVALVTGGNKGIGKEIARQLGGHGYTVLVGSRDFDRGATAARELAADGVDARALQLDVTDQGSVDAAAKTIERDFGRLDLLVNNAGIAIDWGRRPGEVPVDMLRRTYETNVFGAVTVTNAMLPLLRKASGARIVNVSSELGSLTMAAAPEVGFDVNLLAYASSKSALNSVTVTYARDLRAEGIAVNAVNPGYCATDLNDNRGRLSASQGASVAVAVATREGEFHTGQFHTEGGLLPW
jgi:NAD(P)-dependent dehydrogenase (short-subunit alcohol dehydrogenase family)